MGDFARGCYLLVEAHEAWHAEQRELLWRDGGPYAQALFDEAPRERPLDFDRPLPIPEDLLEAFDEIEYVTEIMYPRNEPANIVRFQNEGERAEFHNVRAKKRGAAGTLKTEEWEALRAAFGGNCAYCGSGYRLVLEHVRPLSCGGDTSVGNCVPACWACNQSKGMKSPEEWLGVERAADFRLRWAGALIAIKKKTA